LVSKQLKKNNRSNMLKTKMSKLMKKSSSPSKLSDRSIIGANSTSGNSDHHLSNAATVPPPTIADLIGNREWHVLEGLLMSGAPLCIDNVDLAEHAITEKIVVHFAVRFQAPLRTVSLLSKLYPSSITSPDASGRYPIHVACKWSATPDVINHLIRLNSSAVGVQDNFGKTPMHYLAEFYVANYPMSLERLYPLDQSMMHVVKMLKQAAPACVNLEDNEGCNAIEYALENDVHIKVIKCMQRACRDDWRERSKAGDENGLRRRHSDLIMDLEEMAVNLQDQMKNGGSDKDLLVVHSVLTENNAMPRPIRRGSTVRISNGRVHVDDPNKPMAPTIAAARTA
jgi:hypothetical protein